MKIKNIGSRKIEASVNQDFISVRPGDEAEISLSLYTTLMDSDYKDCISIVKPDLIIPPLTAFKTPEIPTADINFICTLWASNGMGRVGEEELLVLDELGYKINIIAHILEKSGLKPRTLELLEKKYKPSEISLFYAIPETILNYKTKVNYLHIDWDTTKCPKVWSDIINKYVTKVFASSEFTKKSLVNGGVKVPVRIIRHGVHYKDFPYLERNWQGTFNFVTSGDLSTRKGTDVLLEAFQEAFPVENDVRLLIKSNHTLNWGKLSLPKDKRIEFILDRLSPKLYLDLLNKSHCFVFPSRAEGFGLPPLEAMSTGMPTIIHDWSGLSSMANKKFCYVIEPSGKITAEKYQYPEEYKDIGYWGEPNKQALVDTLRYIYDHKDIAIKKGKLASNWVRDKWDWKEPIKEMMMDISHVKKPSWGEFYKKHILTKEIAQSYNDAHKELFWLIRGFYPETIIESGTGQGGMAAWLTWDEQKILGGEPTSVHPKRVVAVDNDKDVLKLAKINMKLLEGKAEVVDENIFEDETKADLIFSQGVLEHFSDDELIRLINHQLKQAPVLVHSVPNDHYGKLDYGNERLLSDEYYYRLLRNMILLHFVTGQKMNLKNKHFLYLKENLNL
jgi:glycosyltransferase involved in cell wall biosynthesis